MRITIPRAKSRQQESNIIPFAVKQTVEPLSEDTYRRVPDHWLERDFWLPYRLEERDGGGMDKKPFNYSTMRTRYKDGGEWVTCTFNEALDAARRASEDGDDPGVGFQCGRGLVVFDLDDALKDGVLQPWAKDALTILRSAYVEVSVSKKGLKAIVECDDPPPGNPKSAPKGEGSGAHRFQHVQFMSTGFNAVTGNTVANWSGEPWSSEKVIEVAKAFGITIREREATAPAAPVQWDEGTVREALSFIDPDCPRDEWIRVGMAIHAGGGDAALWHEWSCGDLTGEKAKTYDRAKAQSAWNSFRNSIGGVGLRSLLSAARKGGWLAVTPGSEAWLVDHAAPLLRPRLRYILEDKDWAFWDEARWHRWQGVRARRLIHETNVTARREILTQAAHLPKKDQGDVFANAKASQTKRVADAVMALLAGDLHGSTWDLDSRTASLLNFRNGMVDLATGALVPHDPDLGFSRVVPFDYERDAPCPLWDQHIVGMFDDPAIAEAFRMFVGYTITGRNDAKTFGILYGEKDTGKSTTSEAIDRALGSDFAETAKRGVFMRQRSVSDAASSHNANEVHLVGVRKINIHEPESGARWDEELVKQWTGGDGIALRRIYGTTETFHPPGVIWALCNELPKADEFSDAFWSRAVVFPCLKPRPRQEGFLQGMLKAERAGIAAWCVRAAADYLARVAKGESPMQAAQRRLETTLVEARFANNPVALWLYRTYEADNGGAVKVAELRDEAEHYFRVNPEAADLPPKAQVLIDGFIGTSVRADAIGRVLKSLGFETERVGAGSNKATVARVRKRASP